MLVSRTFIENYLQNTKNCDIIYMPHNSINKFYRITLYFYRGLCNYALFVFIKSGFGKMQIPLDEHGENPDLLRIVWQQWKSAFSGAFFHGSAPFYFYQIQGGNTHQ